MGFEIIIYVTAFLGLVAIILWRFTRKKNKRYEETKRHRMDKKVD